MSHDQRWSWQPSDVAARLRALGYDVDASDAKARSGSLSARRDQGTRSHVVVLDAGGRFRARVTHGQEEARQVTRVAGLNATVVSTTERTAHISTTLTGPQQLEPLLQSLDEVGNRPIPSGDFGEKPGDPDSRPVPLPPPPDLSRK